LNLVINMLKNYITSVCKQIPHVEEVDPLDIL